MSNHDFINKKHLNVCVFLLRFRGRERTKSLTVEAMLCVKKKNLIEQLDRLISFLKSSNLKCSQPVRV